MRQNVVRQVQLKAGLTSVIVLDQLSTDPLAIVLSRRDLVWLQSFFGALDRGKRPGYRHMQRAVRYYLTLLTESQRDLQSERIRREDADFRGIPPLEDELGKQTAGHRKRRRRN